jgi:hypothetical protein
MPLMHEGALSSYPATFLGCRVYGHAWHDKKDHWTPLPKGAWEVMIPCVRCGSERLQIFDRELSAILKTQTHYSDGYLFAKGNTYKRPECRIEKLRRVTGRTTLRVAR